VANLDSYFGSILPTLLAMKKKRLEQNEIPVSFLKIIEMN